MSITDIEPIINRTLTDRGLHVMVYDPENTCQKRTPDQMDSKEERLITLTATTAAHRPSSDPGRFMETYTRWTQRIANNAWGLEGEPYSYNDIDVAAQVEAYAAARRRASYYHGTQCKCVPCKIRHQTYGAPQYK